MPMYYIIVEDGYWHHLYAEMDILDNVYISGVVFLFTACLDIWTCQTFHTVLPKSSRSPTHGGVTVLMLAVLMYSNNKK